MLILHSTNKIFKLFNLGSETAIVVLYNYTVSLLLHQILDFERYTILDYIAIAKNMQNIYKFSEYYQFWNILIS